LFKAHPLVGEVSLADVDAGKLEENSRRHGLPVTHPSLEHALDSDADAIVLITQNWMHGPQAVQALRAGKHVYSAVPAGISVDEIRDLVRTVEETGLVYMIGETSHYYPGAVYCRAKYREGAFGQVVYNEGEYFHDWDHGLYDVMKQRAGKEWRGEGGKPPMYYPTHSTGGIVSILGARMTHVSCQGFVDDHPDGVYAPGANHYDNRFSCQSALFKMSSGGMCRINEFRRIGHPSVERMSMFGTDACFQNSLAGQVWTDKDGATRLDDLLQCRTHDGFHDMSLVHEIGRLPRSFRSLPNGHQGSHQFLVDDFVKAVHEKKTPPNNVWQAARYVLPGIVAHDSSVRGGELLEIPDFGDPR
jgi:predicted dehydrogenase